MSAHGQTTSAALLDAGAVLPPGTTGRDDADTLTVRTYAHPALDGRRIVRLVPGTLGEAEDLALDFLGLVREDDAPEVGQVRRETLGFPAWALVNDPANGHHALALVKDVERLARQAKSRAGAAKQGFETLGERLGRAVPHFLPTFYEQAARVFLQHENTTYASAFFGKAREAERVHGLAIDEERQRAVFLEFAFAGALTVKALKEYVKDLARRLDPAAAWAQFRQLAVERCAAGMPPYASLPQDARSLVRAAGLDRAAEEGALVANLIASPAVVRAPQSFWTAYRPVLAGLARRRPEVRARLLEIMPTELGRTHTDQEWWLDLLTECGADRLLTGESADGAKAQAASAPGPDAEAGAAGAAGAGAGPDAATGVDAPAGTGVTAAEWLGRWASYRGSGGGAPDRSAATLALVARMAPRLRADGRPVDLFAGRRRSGADVDLLDLCLAEGVPLADPADDAQLGVHRWLRDRQPGRRDLAALGADPRFRPLLYRAVGALGEQRASNELLDEVAGHPVLGDVLREWLDDAAAAVANARGLPGARAALRALRPFRAVVERVSPDALAVVAAHKAAPLLGRTLRAGVLDELGWPALDDALERLPLPSGSGRRGQGALTVTEAWPALILARGDKAVVVGPDGVLLEHDLRIPHGTDQWRRPQFRYADGELLVLWWHENTFHGYWSGRPSEVFTVGGDRQSWWHGDIFTASVPLPGGGRATGGRAFHAGDTDLPASRPVLGDGTAYWRQGRQNQQHVWLEYDPVSGTHGRASLPAFLRSGIRDGARLVQDACEVLPVQPGMENSPFGTDGTVLGRWVRRDGEGGAATVTSGTPDGRTVTLPAVLDGLDVTPLGALRMPGGAEPVVARLRNVVALFAAGDTAGTGELGRCTPGQRESEFRAGTRFVPPVAFWHALRPRDEAGSTALRELTDEQAAGLLQAVARALAEHRAKSEAAGTVYTGPSTDEVAWDAVAGAIPELTDERLLTGVTAIVRVALRHAEESARFVTPPAERERTKRAEHMFADYSPEHGDDATLVAAVGGIALRTRHLWWGPATQWSALRQIRAVNHVLSGRPAEGKPLPAPALATGLEGGWVSDAHTVPGTGVEWLPLLSVLRPLAYRAASPTLPGAGRQALLLLFDALLEGPLAAPVGQVREIVLREEYGNRNRVGQVLRREGRTVVVIAAQGSDVRDGTRWLALDHDPAGRFGAVAHFTLEEEKPRTPGFPAERLAAVAGLVRDKGAAPWCAEAPDALAAATGGALGPVQAALLLGALPQDPDTAALGVLGIKPRQRDLGRTLLRSVRVADQSALVGALLPEDPADLWTAGPDTAAAGRAWEARFGSLVRLPEDIAADLPDVPAGIAEALFNPARTPWLSRTTTQKAGADGELVADDPAAVPGRYELPRAVYTLAALAYRLPYGHPLRAALPGGLAALRRRVADPGLLLDLDLTWTEKGGSTASQIRKAYGLPPAGGADAKGLTTVGDALVLRPWYGDTEAVLLRPAALSGPDDPTLGLLEGLLGAGRCEGVEALRALLGDDLTRTVAAGAAPAGTVAAGAGTGGAGTGGAGFEGHAHDPSVSAPELVAEVASAHGLGEDAAVLYLQLLALPDPTDRACAAWTGWKPTRMRKARAELAATGLVVEAKRSRAGRSLFLPCGWRDLKSPALPLETWKEGLYPVRDRARAVPLLPVPELFARAWGRVRDGDAPAFEELTTRATRKGRRR
ncbi:hypothetical protein [Streptomyces thermolilacinus]|uniref:DNA-binding protein n=1 Tax=Streptomyces thermolilacinus SPC6 TaxID=1306406 RepID=A0A1D3DZ68_9ACTN|nr:hypothetical protein [Streptomyces thermolilacinus]OEJ97622.1 hypothetical protein J116_027380 [Streptomyces thermolilacinus SPC6]